MKKIYLIFFFLFFSLETSAKADYNKYEIKEGNENAKVKIFVFASISRVGIFFINLLKYGITVVT